MPRTPFAVLKALAVPFALAALAYVAAGKAGLAPASWPVLLLEALMAAIAIAGLAGSGEVWECNRLKIEAQRWDEELEQRHSATTAGPQAAYGQVKEAQ